MKTILAWIPVYVAAAGVAEMNPKPAPSGAGAETFDSLVTVGDSLCRARVIPGAGEDTLRLDSCWLAEAEDSAAADQDMTVAAPQELRNATFVAGEDHGGFWFELIGAFINGWGRNSGEEEKSHRPSESSASRELFEKPTERPSRDRGVRRETKK